MIPLCLYDECAGMTGNGSIVTELSKLHKLFAQTFFSSFKYKRFSNFHATSVECWTCFDEYLMLFPVDSRFLNLYDIPVMLVPSTIWAVYSELNKNLVRHEFYHFISITWDSVISTLEGLKRFEGRELIIFHVFIATCLWFEVKIDWIFYQNRKCIDWFIR